MENSNFPLIFLCTIEPRQLHSAWNRGHHARVTKTFAQSVLDLDNELLQVVPRGIAVDLLVLGKRNHLIIGKKAEVT